MIGNLPIDPLELSLIHLAVQLLCQYIYGAKTAVMPGFSILATGISQSNDQPVFRPSSKHGLEQIRNRGAAVNVRYGAGEDRSNIQLLYLFAGAILWQGDGIVDDQFLNGAGFDTVKGRTGENTVGSAGVNCLGTANLYQCICGIAQRTGSIDHIVKENTGLTLDITNDIHNFAHICLLAALINDGKTHMDLCGKRTCTGNRANVRGDDNKIVVVILAFGELFEVIINKCGITQQMIHGNIKKTLDLSCMQIYG